MTVRMPALLRQSWACAHAPQFCAHPAESSVSLWLLLPQKVCSPEGRPGGFGFSGRPRLRGLPLLFLLSTSKISLVALSRREYYSEAAGKAHC